MTLAQLYNLLKATGYPVAYSHFENEQEPPYIVYLVDRNPNYIADNKVHYKISDVTIELYTNKKDLAVEAILESLLDDHEIPYTTYETYIETEQLFQKIYEVRLI